MCLYFGACGVLRTKFWEEHQKRVCADFAGDLGHFEYANGYVLGQRVRVLGGHFVHQALGGPRQREREHDSNHQFGCGNGKKYNYLLSCVKHSDEKKSTESVRTGVYKNLSSTTASQAGKRISRVLAIHLFKITITRESQIKIKLCCAIAIIARYLSTHKMHLTLDLRRVLRTNNYDTKMNYFQLKMSQPRSILLVVNMKYYNNNCFPSHFYLIKCKNKKYVICDNIFKI